MTPAEITVTNLGDSFVTGSGSLRDALTQANLTPEADVIRFAPTASQGTLVLTTSALPDIDTDLMIVGPDNQGLTIMRQAGPPYSILTVRPNRVVSIDNIQISSGNAQAGGILNQGILTVTNILVKTNPGAQGGGIRNEGELIVNSSIFRQNTAQDGAGIYNRGQLTVNGSTFRQNTATRFGGAIFNDISATATVRDSLFEQNRSLHGGAIYNRGEFNAFTTLFISNTTTGDGAGFHNAGGLFLERTTVTGNVANSRGGGIFNALGSTGLVNATVHGNSEGSGGSVHIDAGNVTAVSSTVVNNTRGFFINGGASLNLYNSIVAQNNTTDDIFGTVAVAFNSIIGNGNGTNVANGLNGNQTGTIDLPLNPRIGGLVNNGGPVPTVAIRAGSPAINTGDPTFVTDPPIGNAFTVDATGRRRIVDGTVDIGAFEYQPPATVTGLASNPNPGTIGLPVTLTGTVLGSAVDSNVVQGGTVTFFDDGVELGTRPVIDGVATLVVPSFTQGTHPIEALYNGFTNGNFTWGTSRSARTDLTIGTMPPVPPVPPGVPPGVPPVPPGVPPGVPPVPGIPPVTTPIYAVGPAAGLNAAVRALNVENNALFEAQPFGNGLSFTGGSRVAQADVNGDGIPDLLAVPGPGIAVELKVFDGVTGQQIAILPIFEGSFLGGAFVSVGDFDGDGIGDAVVTPDEGGGPRVRVLQVLSGAVLADFFGIDDPNFRGGARTTAGDLNGDGRDDLVVGAGFGGGPRVAIFDGTSVTSDFRTKLVGDFFAFESSLSNGVFLAIGDLNGDGNNDLFFGGGPGGGPRVLAVDGADLIGSNGTVFTQLANFFAGDPASRGGIHITAKDVDGDDLADLITGSGSGVLPLVTIYRGVDIPFSGVPGVIEQFLAYDSSFLGGVFVG